MTEAYPLQWPDGIPRTKRPEASRFQTSISKAIENVREELRRFGNDTGKPVKDLVLSSNVTLTSQRPSDAGVAAYFNWDGMACCIAVDRYKKVEENLQAIAKVIEADRAKMRHGGLHIVQAAFRGYAALPPPSNKRSCWRVLGVEANTSRANVDHAYMKLAKTYHPDNGTHPDNARMAEINAARDEAMEHLAA